MPDVRWHVEGYRRLAMFCGLILGVVGAFSFLIGLFSFSGAPLRGIQWNKDILPFDLGLQPPIYLVIFGAIALLGAYFIITKVTNK
jgi:hypothetical protein